MAVKYWTGQAALYEISYDTGTNTPVAGETLNVVGAATETCVIQSWTVAGGSWAGNDATGKLWVYSASAAFVTNFASGDDLENSSSDLICNSTSEETLKTGDWQVAGNWGTGEDPAVPVADDEVIFDSRSVIVPSLGMLDSESGATAQCTYDLLHFKKGWAQGVATEAEPLICAPAKLIIQGSGTYYICCGKDDQSTDATISSTAIDNIDAIVYLYSNCNDGANTGLFTTLFGLAGTLTAAYYTQDTDNCGCNIAIYYISSRNDKNSNFTVTCEKDSYDVLAATYPIWHVQNGTVNTDTGINILYFHGGVFNFGTNLGATPEAALDITILYQLGGTFNWYPDDIGIPTIAVAFLLNGSFNANGTLNNDRAKSITDLSMYEGMTVNIANNKANITVSTLRKYGGRLETDKGVQLAITYNQP